MSIVLVVHLPQLNWDSKEDVDWVAYFKSMASKDGDPSFIARVILLAKAQKKATDEANATKTGKKKLLRIVNSKGRVQLRRIRVWGNDRTRTPHALRNTAVPIEERRKL